MVCLASCTQKPAEHEANSNAHFVYSNLLDSGSQDEVYMRLENAGITRETISILDELVEQYNKRMTVFDESDLDYWEGEHDFFDYQEGFVESDTETIAYGDYYNYMKKWYKTGEDDDILCRTLAYLLMGNEIDINQCLPENDWACENEESYLYSDKEVLEQEHPFTFSPEQQMEYFTLFDPADIVGAVSEGAMFQAIQNQWDSYGVQFSDDPLSMVSIWCEDNGVIHNSHVGVLITDEEGLLFLEKTNPLFPYQATKFESKEQVKQYMIATLTAWFESNGFSAPPMVVLENDKML